MLGVSVDTSRIMKGYEEVSLTSKMNINGHFSIFLFYSLNCTNIVSLFTGKSVKLLPTDVLFQR